MSVIQINRHNPTTPCDSSTPAGDIDVGQPQLHTQSNTQLHTQSHTSIHEPFRKESQSPRNGFTSNEVGRGGNKAGDARDEVNNSTSTTTNNNREEEKEVHQENKSDEGPVVASSLSSCTLDYELKCSRLMVVYDIEIWHEKNILLI